MAHVENAQRAAPAPQAASPMDAQISVSEALRSGSLTGRSTGNEIHSGEFRFSGGLAQALAGIKPASNDGFMPLSLSVTARGEQEPSTISGKLYRASDGGMQFSVTGAEKLARPIGGLLDKGLTVNRVSQLHTVTFIDDLRNPVEQGYPPRMTRNCDGVVYLTELDPSYPSAVPKGDSLLRLQRLIGHQISAEVAMREDARYPLSVCGRVENVGAEAITVRRGDGGLTTIKPDCHVVSSVQRVGHAARFEAREFRGAVPDADKEHIEIHFERGVAVEAVTSMGTKVSGTFREVVDKPTHKRGTSVIIETSSGNIGIELLKLQSLATTTIAGVSSAPSFLPLKEDNAARGGVRFGASSRRSFEHVVLD